MSRLVLQGGLAWDGIAEAPVARSLVVEDGKIAGDEVPGGAETLDISGCTALPGLIEGHAHLCFNAGADWRAVYDADTPASMLLRMAGAARSMLEAGITTARDLGAPGTLAIELRDAIRAGTVAGPQLFVSGAPITTTGGHCHFMGGEADGELEVRKAVRQRVKAGSDWIKIMATGGQMTRGTNPYAPQYSVEEVRACVEEAHRLGKGVAAHCHGTEGIRLAVEAGVDTLEHCSFSGRGGGDRDDALIDRIAADGIVVSPTVSVGYRRWTDDGLKEHRRQVTRQLFETRCRVVMSTDCGIPNVPHNALAAGMAVMAELGDLTPVETLRLATSAAADGLGMRDRGTLLPGKRADVVVVEGDPAADLGCLERVRYVIQGGRLAYRSG